MRGSVSAWDAMSSDKLPATARTTVNRSILPACRASRAAAAPARRLGAITFTDD